MFVVPPCHLDRPNCSRQDDVATASLLLNCSGVQRQLFPSLVPSHVEYRSLSKEDLSHSPQSRRGETSCPYAPMPGFVVYLIFLTLFVLLVLELEASALSCVKGALVGQNSRVSPRFAYTVILYYAPETLGSAVHAPEVQVSSTMLIRPELKGELCMIFAS